MTERNARPATVQVSDRTGVRTILLHRPERLNAFDGQLVADLADALEAAAADPGVAVLVLSGSGRAFSAGADLKVLAEHLADPERRERAAGGAGVPQFARLLDALADLPKPLLMAVNGVAVGFGMTVLAFADLVFLSSEARLRCPFTDLGAPPEAASSYLLPQLLGRQHAAWVLLSSAWITAEEALAMGLAWKVCEPDELLEVTCRHADLLASKQPAALAAVKRLLNVPPRAEIAAAVARENAAMVEMFSGGLPAGALDPFPGGSGRSSSSDL